MKVYRGFSDKRLKPKHRCLAIGVFDGVHRGHQRILSRLLADARRFQAKSMVVTFDPHPIEVLNPRVCQPILISVPHRLRFFEKMGIGETLVIPFNKSFSRISREQFLHKFLIERLGMKALFVGEDFCFGHQGKGDSYFLKKESRHLGFRLLLVRPLTDGKDIISSTRIRQLIERGLLKRAERMLGRPVSVYGTVVHGRGRGRSIGFPTANLNPHHETLPPAGVYAAWGLLGGRRLKGVIHIGDRPTFGDREKSLEVHFFNFHQNLYVRELELEFVRRLRPTRCFKSKEALIRAIRKDAQKALKIFA